MTIHLPVMGSEVVALLNLAPGATVVDGTFGGGGHTRLLAAAVGPEGRVIAVDRDPAAIERGRAMGLPEHVCVQHASYADLPDELAGWGVGLVDGIVLDLGLSSDQLADYDRGFSFQATGELDMRFDPRQGEPAWRLLERLNQEQLANLIYRYGEEGRSRVIARRIVERRRSQPIRTAEELASLVRGCVPRSRQQRIDPATRTFQALRIAVNQELQILEEALQRLPAILRIGGRIAVISFHSLEDRLVKHGFREHPLLDVVTRKPLRPSVEEMDQNPRARSARLRVAERRVDEPRVGEPRGGEPT